MVEIVAAAELSGGAYVHELPTKKHNEAEFLFEPGRKLRLLAKQGRRIVMEVMP